MLDVKLELINPRPVKQMMLGALLVLKPHRSNVLDVMTIRFGELSWLFRVNPEGTTISRATNCEICSF